MTEQGSVGVEFGALLTLLGDRLYSTPHAFLRENVQNAVDAVRLLKLEGRSQASKIQVEIRVQKRRIEIEDWGIGMSVNDLKEYYFRIGRTSKDNSEAKRCGVIGKFGIGAFANFGVCTELQVHAWKRGAQKISCKLSREKLQRNNTEYTISPNAQLNHLGTLVIGVTDGDLDIEKLKVFISDHVRYLPEKIAYNGEIISGKAFPAVAVQRPPLVRSDLELKESISVGLEFYKFEDELQLSLISRDEHHGLDGLLMPKMGDLRIYVNGFMVAPRWSLFFSKSMPFTGDISSNFLQPNIAREGLDYESSELIGELLNSVTKETIRVLSEEDMLFKRPELVKFVVRYSPDDLGSFRVRQYGKKAPVKLAEVVEAHAKAGLRVLLTTVDPPIQIASVAVQQGVILLMLDDVGPDLRQAVVQYLESKANATMMAEFELTATPLEEQEITAAMRSVCASIREALRNNWGLTDPLVVLCRLSENNHITMREIGDQPEFLVNVESPIFQELTKNIGAPFLVALVHQLLIAPQLSDVLVRFIPRDFSAALASFRPKPLAVRLEKVTTIQLIRGGGWDGPSEECIKIESSIFKDLEGYYIRLPERVSEALRPFLSSSEPPSFMWMGDTAYGLFQVGDDKLIALEIKNSELIVSKNSIHGSVSEKRRILVYKTGLFVPIPVPPFRDVLPLNSPKELAFSFRCFGCEIQ